MKKLYFIPFSIFIWIFSSFQAFAEDSFDSFALMADSWVQSMEGVIVSVSGNEAAVDIGKGSGIFKGACLRISRQGEELLHPVTGESLGRKLIIVGDITITGVYPEYSEGRLAIKKGEAVKKGDFVSVEKPLPVMINFSSLDKKNGAEAKFAILKSGLFAESDNSSYSFGCLLNKEDSKAACSFSYGGVRISSANIVLDLPKITTASNTVKITGGRGEAVHLFSFPTERIMVSIAAGRVFSDVGIAAVLTDGDAVYIYSLENNSLKEAAVIDKDFTNIVNVETADLNGNGRDEIFISNVSKKGEVSSAVYEYNGTAFIPLKTGVKFLFRSFFTGGKKTLTCQAFTEGDFTGLIYSYGYSDGVYEEKEAFDRSFGAKLYGFAYGDLLNRGGETFSFNNTGNFTVTFSDGMRSVFGKDFGYTPHKLLYSKTLLTDTEKGNDGALINIFDTKVYGFPIYQRIIELNGQAGKFFMISNEAKRRRDGSVDYRKSSAGTYMFVGREALNLWKYQGGNKVALESDVIYGGSEGYIFTLSQIGKNGKTFDPISGVVDVFKVSY